LATIEQIVRAPAGAFVFVRRGTVHAPRVVSDEPGRVLILFVPGGQEGAFDDLAALAAEIGGRPDHDDERVQAIAARYDSVFVGPPL
jgi:hypothetical protein